MRLDFQNAATFPMIGFDPHLASQRPAWHGFLVEKRICAPGDTVAESTRQHVITMLCARAARLEYRGEGGRLVNYVETPGSVTIIPAGRMPEIQSKTAAEFIHCGLDEGFIRGVIAEMECPPAAAPVFRVGLRDTSIQRILSLLIEEVEADAPSGRLYVESLAHALATRYLLLEGNFGVRPESGTCALPPRILNRVREKIEANLCTDVSLEALADESGYSRAHFLRMFREATGITPHQYIMDVRLRHAQDWLERKGTTLIDIAATCGFSSQSHMTTAFRKRLGVTPAEFRRESSGIRTDAHGARGTAANRGRILACATQKSNAGCH